MSAREMLPSAITALGIHCGVLAIIWAPEHPYWACDAVIAASLCDMIDGRVARMLDATSPFGAQLDSLADIVSFVAAPAVLVYVAALRQPGVVFDPWLLVALAFLTCGAIRLARFNVRADTQEGPVYRFVGIPTPAAALLVTTLIMTSMELELDVLARRELVAGVVLAASVLMVSSIRFPSYKKFRRRAGQLAFYGAILGGLVMLLLGLPGGTVLFVVMSGYGILGLLGAVRERGDDVRA